MRWWRVVGLWSVVAAGCLLGAAGCEKPLFPEGLPRTQYERYDRLRGRYTPAEEPNRFGGTEPALRERLTSPPE